MIIFRTSNSIKMSQAFEYVENTTLQNVDVS